MSIHRVVFAVVSEEDNTTLIAYTLNISPQSIQSIFKSTQFTSVLETLHNVSGFQILKRDFCSADDYTKAINTDKQKNGSEWGSNGSDKIREMFSNHKRSIKDIVNELLGTTDGGGDKGGEEKGTTIGGGKVETSSQ
jgi:hypothetical protein